MLLNSIEVSKQPIPVSADRIDRSVWGVATWVDVDPRIDFYNLTNEAVITNWLTTLGPTYHRASTVQQGRMIKLGF